MKKKLFAAAMAGTMVLSLAACGGSKPAETTAAPAETTTTAAETSSEAEAEEDYTSGVITAIDGDILTVKDDYDDQERKYDISKAEVTKDFPLSEGDWVDLTVPANTTEDPIPAIAMEVTASMLEQSMDPVADGTVKDVASDSMTLEVDGEDYKVLTGNAYVVGKDGIQTGAAAEVTYLGDLDDEPLAIKIVMDDAKDTDEARSTHLSARLHSSVKTVITSFWKHRPVTFSRSYPTVSISASTLRVIPFRSSMTV